MFTYLLVLVLFINFIIILDDQQLSLNSKRSHSSIDKRSINHHFIDRIDCEEFKENVTLIKRVAEGVVKDVFVAKWSINGYIAVSFLKNPLYSDDFKHNIHMLRNFTNSKFTSHFLGSCDDKILFTKFYRLGPLSNLGSLLKHKHLFNLPVQAKDCFQFCIHYAQVIDFLHNSPLGTRVMCDSNDLAKLMSQFMIDDDLSVVANDLDALPDATHHPIKCGHRSLIGDLIAPEQKLPNRPSYDQQIDIYKLPYLCNYLLSLCPKDELLELLVNQLHTKCLNELPSMRPSSRSIVEEYLRINYTLF